MRITDLINTSLTSHPLKQLIELLHLIDSNAVNLVFPDKIFDLRSLRRLVDYTQKNWLRKPGLERWHIKDKSSYVQHRDSIIDLLSSLGFIEEIIPDTVYYDYLILLGSSNKPLIDRMNHIHKLWMSGLRFSQIDLLVTDLALDSICIKSMLDEGIHWEEPPNNSNDLTKIVYEQLASEWPADLRRIQLNWEVLFGLNSATQQRTNTKDTLEYWANKNKNGSKLLIISNQPYLLYQGTVADSVLSKRYQTITVGPKARIDVSVADILDSFARYLYECHLALDH